MLKKFQYVIVTTVLVVGPGVCRTANVPADKGRCLRIEGQVKDAVHFVEKTDGEVFDNFCIQRVTRPDLTKLLDGSQEHVADSPKLVSAYFPGSRTIYILNTLDLSDPVDLSYLVHELQHLVQDQDGEVGKGTAVGVLEYEAYGLQADYLQSKGFRSEAFAIRLLGLVQATPDNDYQERNDYQ